MTTELKSALSEYAVLCEKNIENIFNSMNGSEEFSGKNADYTSTLSQSMEYSLTAGGKRLRPYITMEVCKMLCGDTTPALSYATALEMIHTYSLIHDDLPCMDNDTLRRGKPTNHVKFGEAVALLAGDSLLTDAFFVLCNNNLSPAQNNHAVKLLSKCAGSNGMALGQQIDLCSEGKEIPSYILDLLVYKKTAALFTAACGLGCIAAGYTNESKEYQALETFSKELGLAFQITDDILDVTGSVELVGKTLGKDKDQDKNTYVSVYGLENAKQKAKDAINSAISALEILPQNQSKENLISLAEYILTREH